MVPSLRNDTVPAARHELRKQKRNRGWSTGSLRLPRSPLVCSCWARCADDGASPATTPVTQPPASTGTDLAVTRTDSLRFEPDALTVPAGEQVMLTFSAETGVEHDFVVEDAADVGIAESDDLAYGSEEGDGDVNSDDLHVVHADVGQTTRATFQMYEPGPYTVDCSVPGHREGGMLATPTVVEGS